MLATFRLKLAILVNRIRRRNGPSLADQCAKVIMRVCALQLERAETRELAPTPGATGPMQIFGGAITTVTYKVFDTEADKVDKAIRLEPWRAFVDVTMRLALERDPQFEVSVTFPDGKGCPLDPNATHKSPGLELVKQLSQYFPLLPKPHTGPTYAPVFEDTK